MQIWEVNFGMDIGKVKCPICKINYITQMNFEAGHKKAESKGGTTDKNNLIPICSLCNRSQGSMEFNKFIQENTIDLNLKNRNKNITKTKIQITKIKLILPKIKINKYIDEFIKKNKIKKDIIKLKNDNLYKNNINLIKIYLIIKYYNDLSYKYYDNFIINYFYSYFYDTIINKFKIKNMSCEANSIQKTNISLYYFIMNQYTFFQNEQSQIILKQLINFSDFKPNKILILYYLIPIYQHILYEKDNNIKNKINNKVGLQYKNWDYFCIDEIKSSFCLDCINTNDINTTIKKLKLIYISLDSKYKNIIGHNKLIKLYI